MALTAAAHADDTPAEAPSRHTEAPPDSSPNTEADAPLSSQAKSKGFIEDSHLNLLMRSFIEHDEFKGAGKKDAWVLGAQVVFESGYTKGLIGLGGDVSLFGTFKLNGGHGAGNRVHLSSSGDPSGANQLAWAYPGVWDVKARVSNTVLKYGQQLFDNPFLVPHDNRALSPTYRGFSLASDEIKNLTLKAGTIDSVIARGMTTVTGLTTEYGRHACFAVRILRRRLDTRRRYRRLAVRQHREQRVAAVLPERDAKHRRSEVDPLDRRVELLLHGRDRRQAPGFDQQ